MLSEMRWCEERLLPFRDGRINGGILSSKVHGKLFQLR